MTANLTIKLWEMKLIRTFSFSFGLKITTDKKILATIEGTVYYERYLLFVLDVDDVQKILQKLTN